MKKTILVTGGCGFIGSHFIRHIIKTKDWRVINLDNLSYAGDRLRVKDIDNNKRYQFIKGDIRKIEDIYECFKTKIDTVFHFAAESHVDNSIIDPFIFEAVNCLGTLNLLTAAKEKKVKKFIHISTDEVYGDIKKGKFKEDSPFAPNSPYSASKTASDCFVRAFVKTYKFPAVIIRASNNYGPWQYPEKFIPVVVCRALRNKKIPVYAKGLNIREWMYVEDTARAIDLLARKAEPGEVYNVGSEDERRNIDVAKKILKILNKPQSLLKFVADRPGHDFRYSLNSSKVRKLGWKPKTNFEQGIKKTVNWYKEYTFKPNTKYGLI